MLCLSRIEEFVDSLSDGYRRSDIDTSRYFYNESERQTVKTNEMLVLSTSLKYHLVVSGHSMLLAKLGLKLYLLFIQLSNAGKTTWREFHLIISFIRAK